jgi:serine/threonine-protein kinase RsbW
MESKGEHRQREVKIPSDPAVARQLQDEIEQALQHSLFGEREIFCIRLALEEALVNAIKHGNQADRNKNVHVSYRVAADRFEIDIRDEGPGFDPQDVPDPLAVENLERPCGRGLLLMRHYMTEVIFHAPGNRVSMNKVCTNPGRNGHA